ncbi:hypothetical protein [Sphingomonas sp. UYP23]
MEGWTMHRCPSRAAGYKEPLKQVSATDTCQATLKITVSDAHPQAPDEEQIFVGHVLRPMRRSVPSCGLYLFPGPGGFAACVHGDLDGFGDQAHRASGWRQSREGPLLREPHSSNGRLSPDDIEDFRQGDYLPTSGSLGQRPHRCRPLRQCR